MTSLLVQEYLKTHSLAQLKAEHGIKSSAVPGNYKFSLNYDQIESKAGPMVNQCRGLILAANPLKPLQDGQVNGEDPVGETTIMARPFERFFNLGDSNAAPVDMNHPETVFFEKLDGTLCILYFDPEQEEWHIATRAVPEADKNINGWDDLTFRKLFEVALRDVCSSPFTHPGDFFQHWTGLLDRSKTYMFELCTPQNRIVVEYKTNMVFLLGIRDTQTGVETDITGISDQMDIRSLYGVPTCPFHSLANMEELLKFVGSKPPFEQEGVVVRDKDGNRVKVKSMAYMAYNRVRDSTANSPRAVLELILSEQLDDVLPVLEPHMQRKATELQEKVRLLFQRVEEDFQEISSEAKGEENQRKAFAIGVQDRGAWMGPLMDRFLGKSTSLLDYLQKRKLPNGTYPDGLLDSVITEANQL